MDPKSKGKGPYESETERDEIDRRGSDGEEEEGCPQWAIGWGQDSYPPLIQTFGNGPSIQLWMRRGNTWLASLP